MIYFVRHGETVWNVENKICGITDSPLTEKGHRQAAETGRKIREKERTEKKKLVPSVKRPTFSFAPSGIGTIVFRKMKSVNGNT